MSPKLPKPRISMRSPFTSVLLSASRMALTASSVSLVVNCGKWAASRLMSSERIIGEFYAALPLGSGGKAHNARRGSIDDASQRRRPPDVDRAPSPSSSHGRSRLRRDPETLPLADAMNSRVSRRKSSAKTQWPVLTAKSREHSLVSNLERRTVLRPGLAVIVNARSGDVGVTQPLLHLGDVGLVVKRVGRSSRPQRVRPDRETQRR